MLFLNCNAGEKKTTKPEGPPELVTVYIAREDKLAKGVAPVQMDLSTTTSFDNFVRQSRELLGIPDDQVFYSVLDFSNGCVFFVQKIEAVFQQTGEPCTVDSFTNLTDRHITFMAARNVGERGDEKKDKSENGVADMSDDGDNGNSNSSSSSSAGKNPQFRFFLTRITQVVVANEVEVPRNSKCSIAPTMLLRSTTTIPTATRQMTRRLTTTTMESSRRRGSSESDHARAIIRTKSVLEPKERVLRCFAQFFSFQSNQSLTNS